MKPGFLTPLQKRISEQAVLKQKRDLLEYDLHIDLGNQLIEREVHRQRNVAHMQM